MQKSAPVVLSQVPDIVTVCRVLQIRLDRAHHLRVLLLPLRFCAGSGIVGLAVSDPERRYEDPLYRCIF